MGHTFLFPFFHQTTWSTILLKTSAFNQGTKSTKPESLKLWSKNWSWDQSFSNQAMGKLRSKIIFLNRGANGHVLISGKNHFLEIAPLRYRFEISTESLSFPPREAHSPCAASAAGKVPACQKAGMADMAEDC